MSGDPVTTIPIGYKEMNTYSLVMKKLSSAFLELNNLYAVSRSKNLVANVLKGHLGRQISETLTHQTVCTVSAY